MASSNFRCQFQFDSTIVFENLTDPFNAGNTFAWNFGDGTTQNFEENPMHVFPKFDTSYKVCLIVTNNCGVSTFCDSVYLDSLHWGGTLYSRVNKQISNELTKNENRIIHVAIYPNPTLGIGYISYDFSGISTSGILLIMDSQGRIVFEKDLNNIMYPKNGTGI